MTSFRPLSGYLISKCCTDDTTKNTLFCFRPLSGYLISKLRLVYGYTTTSAKVSVPSRGILFPNNQNELYHYGVHGFPSPLGVSYFQIHKKGIKL